MDEAELLGRYLRSAYAAMDRELPADLDLAADVCMHWAGTGNVLSLKDWLDRVTESPGEDGDLNFKIIRADGSVEPLRAPGL